MVECYLDVFLLIEIFGWMLLRCFCLCFLYLKDLRLIGIKSFRCLFVKHEYIWNHVLILLVSFRGYLSASKMIQGTKFDKAQSVKKSLTTCNAIYSSMLPPTSLICFVKTHAKRAYVRVERHIENPNKHITWNFF